ncbi:MAG: alginate lyase family protein [Acidobacteria bacterium]|nr:alginate lyase family protein [Acidobacteriota bacterium]
MDEEKKDLSLIPHPSSLRSSLLPKIRRALRGEVDASTVALEALRRGRVSLRQRRERAMLDQLNRRPARLCPEYARLSPTELLEHFRRRAMPKFLPGLDVSNLKETARLQRELFPVETKQLLKAAARITTNHRWPLLGYGEQDYDAEINWLRDPVAGTQWPLDYHADINLARGDGSDARVLWELNRFGHLITLGRAYALMHDEKFAAEFFAQCESWREQNPAARGPNWACAMEVALRAMNLVISFELFRSSPLLDEVRLVSLITLFDQHGEHIRRNLEFSYISTSNHYLSDVVGLFWLGTMLPELEAARRWREFGLREMLREMDKQILADGADCEASTGYHRFVLELFLHSFILARANGIEIEERYWRKLRAMLEYVRAYLRPCGRAPLIGDTDSGQVLPIRTRAADDHAYVLALGAALFNESRFKDGCLSMPEELLWISGPQGVSEYESLTAKTEDVTSKGFKDAGTYVMREGDLYLLFNASGNGLGGRGSHGHNDALSLEVSACGREFIVDPGTYVYTSDLRERQLFRATAYHSTVEVDGAEQNTTLEGMPFVMGDEAHPRVLTWDSAPERDRIVAEHDGYARPQLPGRPITHRRTIEFAKLQRYWTIEDALTGEGEHVFRFRYHFAENLDLSVGADRNVRACDKMTGARLVIVALDGSQSPALEERYASRDYGEKHKTVSACWTLRARAPFTCRWLIVPICAGEDENARLELTVARAGQ